MQRWHLLVLITALGVSVLPARAIAAPSGTIAAHPNPCVIQGGEKTCASHITWSTQDVARAMVYVVHHGKNGREEKEFGNSRACESERCRAPWIEAGKSYRFTLYDYSTGNRGRALASVEVTATGGFHK